MLLSHCTDLALVAQHTDDLLHRRSLFWIHFPTHRHERPQGAVRWNAKSLSTFEKRANVRSGIRSSLSRRSRFFRCRSLRVGDRRVRITRDARGEPPNYAAVGPHVGSLWKRNQIAFLGTQEFGRHERNGAFSRVDVMRFARLFKVAKAIETDALLAKSSRYLDFST